MAFLLLPYGLIKLMGMLCCAVLRPPYEELSVLQHGPM